MLRSIINHRNAYVLGLMGVVFSLSVSVYSLSISLFWLAANWLIEGKRIARVRLLFQKSGFWLLTGILLLGVLGLIHTVNFDYAIDDLRIKLPLFLLPFFIGSTLALTRKEFEIVWLFFLLGLLVSSGFVLWNYLQLDESVYQDRRELSVFISHIRFSLMLVVAALLTPYFTRTKNRPIRIIGLSLSAWFIFIVILLRSVSGIAVLIAAVLSLYLWYLLNEKSRSKQLLGVGAGIIGISLLVLVVFPPVSSFFKVDQIDPAKLPYHTPSGNIYYHDLDNGMVENGHVVWAYVCWKELRTEWEKKSDIPIDGIGKSGEQIQTTLIRFLTSKADPKDSTGVSRLSEKEVKAIENGETNYYLMDEKGFQKRIYETAWEVHSYYMRSGNPEGNSAAQRLEFWKASWYLISNNWLFGVGTGDIVDEMHLAYEETGSYLSDEFRLKPHNQFLTTWISFGVFGLLWFLFVFVQPFYTGRARLPYLVFATVAMTSMLIEDTIESQIGVTFVAFFYSLFVLGIRPDDLDQVPSKLPWE